MVAPSLDGGATVALSDARVLRLKAGARGGWLRVKVSGRTAEVVRPAELDEIEAALAKAPRVRGHVARIDGDLRLSSSEKLIETVALPPEDEPAQLSPALCRRWPSGDLLWGGLEFESEVEES